MTSRWLVDAAGQTGADIEWRNLSLAVVNTDREIPEQYRSAVEAGVRAHRVIRPTAGRGPEPHGRRVLHRVGPAGGPHDGREPSTTLAAEVAEAVGAGKWAPAADDESWDAEVKRSTEEGQALAGGDVGSPVLSFGSPAVGVFGR